MALPGGRNCPAARPSEALEPAAERKTTKVHVATCLVEHCPCKDTMLAKIKAKVDVEMIEGLCPHVLQNILA